MVFVDDEGLEEQFLTEDEDTPNVLDTTACTSHNNTSRGSSRKQSYSTNARRRACQ